MNLTITDIIIAIITWHLAGAVIGILMGIAQYHIGAWFKKLQLKEMTKNAPEVVDNRVKGKK